MRTQGKSAKKWFGIAVVATVLVGVVVALLKVRRVDVESTAAAADIEARLDGLDAATKAAAMSKVAAEGF